jgi:hypothetical protein
LRWKKLNPLKKYLTQKYLTQKYLTKKYRTKLLYSLPPAPPEQQQLQSTPCCWQLLCTCLYPTHPPPEQYTPCAIHVLPCALPQGAGAGQWAVYKCGHSDCKQTARTQDIGGPHPTALSAENRQLRLQLASVQRECDELHFLSSDLCRPSGSGSGSGTGRRQSHWGRQASGALLPGLGPYGLHAALVHPGQG